MEIQRKILIRSNRGSTIAEVLGALVLLLALIAMLSGSLMSALKMAGYAQSYSRATQDALAAYYTDDTAKISKTTEDADRDFVLHYAFGAQSFELQLSIDTYTYSPEDQSEVKLYVFER